MNVLVTVQFGPTVRQNLTDRAKRYRAQKNVTGPRRCVLCGSTEDLGVMHLDGEGLVEPIKAHTSEGASGRRGRTMRPGPSSMRLQSTSASNTPNAWPMLGARAAVVLLVMKCLSEE